MKLWIGIGMLAIGLWGCGNDEKKAIFGPDTGLCKEVYTRDVTLSEPGWNITDRGNKNPVTLDVVPPLLSGDSIYVFNLDTSHNHGSIIGPPNDTTCVFHIYAARMPKGTAATQQPLPISMLPSTPPQKKEVDIVIYDTTGYSKSLIIKRKGTHVVSSVQWKDLKNININFTSK